MHQIHQLLFALWILASFGDNVQEADSDSTHHVSITTKYLPMDSSKGHSETFSMQRKEGKSESGHTKGTKLLESSSIEMPHLHTGNYDVDAADRRELPTTYSGQHGVSVARSRRASESAKSINPKRHARQKKSNHIMQRKSKFDRVSSDTRSKTKKRKKKQKEFTIKLPFPNFEDNTERSRDHVENGTINGSAEAGHSYDHNAIGVGNNDGMGQYVINVDNTLNENSGAVQQRKPTKRSRLTRKVRVPLPFNSASKHRKKDLINKQDKEIASYRRHRKQKKRRLPPLH